MLSRDAVVRDAYETGLPRAVAVAAAIWQVSLLVQVLAYLPDFRQRAVILAVWAGLLATAVWLVPRAWRGGLSGPEGLAAVIIAVAAVAVVGWERRPHETGSVDWSVVGTAWLLALVALSRPAWVWVSGAVAVFVVHAVLIVHLLGTSSLVLARLAASAYSLVAILSVFAALRPAAAAYALIAARRAELQNRAATEHAAAEAVQQDRRERLEVLEAEALPLLRGLADGTLDPAGEEVRHACARHAATLRRALASRASVEGGVLAALEPAFDSAQARGLTVEIQVLDDLAPLTPEAAEATVTAVDAVLDALPPHPVTLTVLAGADEAELYLTFGQPLRAVPELPRPGAAPGWRAGLDAGCLEVRWRVVAG
jgi:hypothetical protein